MQPIEMKVLWLKWDFSFKLTGPTEGQWQKQNGGPYSDKTTIFVLLVGVGGVLVCSCRSEERKTQMLLQLKKKFYKRLPLISQWSLSISKYPAAKQAVLEFVCHILKGCLRICSFWQGTLCERTVKHIRHLNKITLIEQDGFEANPTNWASWFWGRFFSYSQENSEYFQWLRIFF